MPDSVISQWNTAGSKWKKFVQRKIKIFSRLYTRDGSPEISKGENMRDPGCTFPPLTRPDWKTITKLSRNSKTQIRDPPLSPGTASNLIHSIVRYFLGSLLLLLACIGNKIYRNELYWIVSKGKRLTLEIKLKMITEYEQLWKK